MRRLCLACLVLVTLSLSVAACQAPKAPGTPTPRPTAIVQGSAQTSALQQAFAKSPHTSTFVTDGDGNNNTCSRCHSPNNWTPTDPADMPETCASCKFTIKTPKPVSKEDWKSIECEICHRVENGVLSPEIAFLNTAVSKFDTSAEPYEAVNNSTELCRKCHSDAHGVMYGVDMGSGPHASFGCTKCHDAHAATADCAQAGCHAGVLAPSKPIPGHDAAHAAVACSACHDASKLQVGLTADKKNWTTYKAPAAGSKDGPVAYSSHNLSKQVDCARCHFAGNTWGLKTVTSP